MPAYYRSALGGFLDEAAPKILWNLAQANASARFPIAPQAIEAWNIQLPVLRNGFSRLIAGHAAATTWGILLEYPIPMIGKRIDAVLLAHDAIFVIETKTGLSPSSAARQVDDYALNLACFHEYSLGKKIVPLVVSGSHVSPSSSKTQFDHLIESCRCVGTAEFGSLLKQLCKEYVDEDEPGIDPAEWDSGRFKPIPPIIDAAVALYSGMDVFEIGHACAAREDLDKTTNALVGAVLESQAALQKTVCFTTGVPGAGKTLVGLNAVHRPEVKNDSLFLSGNGPLVRVLQEALLRDVIEREPRKTKRQAKLEIQAFIHNVHRFTEEYYGDSKKEPKHRVVVFDEAQRAWDAAQNKRKGRPSISEPEMILEVMDRHKDWAVIVALVGNGQEIHRGEAGLAEWGRALARFPHWKVCASPLVLRTDVPLTLRLFETSDITPRKLSMLDALHLKVSTRAIRAQRISDWVDAVLGGRQSEAAAIASSLGTRPVITRDINMARAWLNENRRGRTRAGLAASARAARLRASDPGSASQPRRSGAPCRGMQPRPWSGHRGHERPRRARPPGRPPSKGGCGWLRSRWRRQARAPSTNTPRHRHR